MRSICYAALRGNVRLLRLFPAAADEVLSMSGLGALTWNSLPNDNGRTIAMYDPIVTIGVIAVVQELDRNKLRSWCDCLKRSQNGWVVERAVHDATTILKSIGAWCP
jgi:hypothetical protein